MAISNDMCTSFRKQLLEGVHDFRLSGGDTFKIALYTSAANLDDTTTIYSATNETSGTNYTAGGENLTRVDPTTSGTTAYTDFEDQTWSSASFTANGALIYNSSASNAAVVTLAFGGDKTASDGNFTVQFPNADATNAIIRIGD